MDLLRIFIVTFFVVYLLYLFLVILNNKKKKKIFETQQALLVIKPYNLDVSKINKNKFCQVISIANSFIVALTLTISELFDNYFIKLIACFIVLIILILIVYKLIGFVYKKKEGK